MDCKIRGTRLPLKIFHDEHADATRDHPLHETTSTAQNRQELKHVFPGSSNRPTFRQ